MEPKMMRRITFLLAIALFACSILTASGCGALKVNGTVAGQVYMFKKLMHNFEVQLINEGGAVVASGKTNNQGHFIIQDVPPGNYTIQVLNFSGVQHPGVDLELRVRPGRTEKIKIDLGGGKLPEPKPNL